MTHFFDGKKYSEDKLKNLEKKLKTIAKKPVLAVVLVGDDPASHLYADLKKKKGDKIGIEVKIIKLFEDSEYSMIIKTIEELNSNIDIDGIMIQLPLPSVIKDQTKKITQTIVAEKDVDGLREDSMYTHPTSKAVIKVLKYALNIVRPTYKDGPLTLTLVGSSGMVGRPLVKELRIRNKELWERGLNLVECDLHTKNLKKFTINSDVVISATGVPNLINTDIVKENSILIDVGSPVGDIDKVAYKKAAFVSPVPGGVGPVTVACLFENLIDKFSPGV